MSWFKSKKPMTEEELSRINWHPTSPRDEFLWRDLAIEENFNVASKAAYLADTKLRLVLDVISSLTGKAISSEDFATYVAPDLFQVINLGGIHNMGPREREYFAVAGWNTLGTIFPGRIEIATAFMSKLNENKLFHLVEAIAMAQLKLGAGWPPLQILTTSYGVWFNSPLRHSRSNTQSKFKTKPQEALQVNFILTRTSAPQRQCGSLANQN
jgi:hypothetical protein